MTRRSPALGLELTVSALVGAGFGSVPAIEHMPLTDFLRYAAILAHQRHEEAEELKRARRRR